VALRGFVQNPFSPKAVVYYDLPEPGRGLVRVFDANGQLIRTLVDEEISAGHHHVEWDGVYYSDDLVSAGVYFCKLEACGEVMTGKMILLG
jgi:flagellar hook assembly protein FlgD